MGSGIKATAIAWLSMAALTASFSTQALAADTRTAAGNDDQIVAAGSGQNPFADVQPSNWAYQAVQQLHADGLIEGYPDGYFKGNRPLTRYEIAVLTQRVVDKVEGDLSDASKAAKVNSDDIALIRKLLDNYGSDLADVKKTLAGVKAESDANADQLRKTHIGVTYFLRPGLSRDTSTITNQAGAEQVGSTGLFGNINNRGGANNSVIDGNSKHGTGYQILRIALSGDIDDHTSYAVRLSDTYDFDSYKGAVANQNGTTSQGSTTGTDLGSFGNSSGSAIIDYANIQYKRDNFTLTGGRFLDKDGPIGLLWEDYFNGAEIAYAKNHLEAKLGYSFDSAVNSNGQSTVVENPNGTTSAVPGTPSQTLLARVAYDINDKVKVGLNYSDDINFSYSTFGASAYNSTALGYDLVTDSRQSNASIDAEIRASKLLDLQGELARHFGKDPVTGQTYRQPFAFWGKAFYGNTAPKLNHNYAEVGYIVAGVNGLSPHSETYGEGDDYQQFYLNSADGYHIVYGGVHHFFSDNARIGLVYQRYALNPGVKLPGLSIGNGGGNGLLLTKDVGQALFLETLLQI